VATPCNFSAARACHLVPSRTDASYASLFLRGRATTSRDGAAIPPLLSHWASLNAADEQRTFFCLAPLYAGGFAGTLLRHLLNSGLYG